MLVEPRRKLILIVDDEVNVIHALNRVLYRDFKIIVAVNGRHALDVLANVEGIAALMTELKMPFMDGIQLLTVAKSARPRVPRILFTGEPDRRQIDEALGVGVLGALYKPLDAVEVGQFLRLAVSDHWDKM